MSGTITEGVPPDPSEPGQADATSATSDELRARGEQLLSEGHFVDAAQSLTQALNLKPGDEDLPLLIANAMQKAALVGPTAVDAPPALVGKIQVFLADAGIGGGEGEAQVSFLSHFSLKFLGFFPRISLIFSVSAALRLRADGPVRAGGGPG